MDILNRAIPVTMLVFVVSSMLGVGLSLTVNQILAPLRNLRVVSLALLGNFVLMPLGAFVIARFLRLDEPLGVALLLLGTAAGAPFLPLLARISKGNLAYAVGLMVLLMVETVAYMPLVLPLLLEGVSVDPLKIARSLVVLMLAPLAIGLLVKARLSGRSRENAAFVKQVIDSKPCVADCPSFNHQHAECTELVRDARHSSILFITVGCGLGWICGGPGSDTKNVLSLGTAQRNIAASLVVGGQ